MKRKRYTEEQIIGILKEAEAGVPVAELCRKYGMSDVSFYTCAANTVGWKFRRRSGSSNWRRRTAS